MRHAFRPSWIPLLLLLLAFAFHLASPQSGTGGSIAGQVADSGGRLFPALVTIRNTATGGISQTFCDRNGNFRFAELAPGNLLDPRERARPRRLEYGQGRR